MLRGLPTMIRRHLELQRIEKLSRAELEALKLVKFRRLVRHVHQHSPYYAQIIREGNIDIETCVPEDFPVLTKPTLMANFDRIVTDRRITKAAVTDFLSGSVDPNELLFGEYRVVHTSGSSGEVGLFLYSRDDWLRGLIQADTERQQSPPPRRFGRFKVAYYAAVGGHFAGTSMWAFVMQGLWRLFVRVELLEINSPASQVIERLNNFQPDFISGYTAGLKVLAEKQNEGVLRVSPTLVGTGGEAMTPADKALLEGAFQCEVVNGYASSEHLLMGVSNPDGETMTLHDSDLIYEMFDDHSLVTNLFNYTQPLIRYRMSDILRPVAESDSTSPYLVIKSVIGRSEKAPAFVNRDGVEDFIHPCTISELFIAGVAQFQMRLIDETSFRFAVVLESSLDQSQQAEAVEATKQRLREVLDQKLMQNVTFEVVPVNHIPVDPQTGKFKLIVDDPQQLQSAILER